MRTAVLGATGFVGRALVPALAQRGEVVAVSRRATAPQPPGVRSVAADLTDRESTRGALEGVDVAYHLIHSLDARNFSELDRRVAENVVAEADRAVSPRSSISAGSATTHPTSRHTCAAEPRPAPSSRPEPFQ